jgi:hypothetical protein
MDFQYGNYSQAIGFAPGGLLAGLRPGSTPAQQAAYGAGMSDIAGMGLQRAQENQAASTDQMQNESQQRMAGNQNRAQRSSNESEERMGRGSLANRQKLFNITQRFGYAAMNKQRQMRMKQGVLEGLAGGNS